MLEVDIILPLTTLVLCHPVPESVCEMQTPALFTMVQTSPEPQTLDTANYKRVNPLPSPATPSSSSSELHLYFESDTSSASVLVGSRARLKSFFFQGDQPAPQPANIIQPTSYFPSSVPQPPTQPPQSSSWADEVANAEQSGQSLLETVVPNWAYRWCICHQYCLPHSTNLQGFHQTDMDPQIHHYDLSWDSLNRLRTINQHPRTTTRVRTPLHRAPVHEIYPVRTSPIQASQSQARHSAGPSRGPEPSSSQSRGRGIAISPTHGITHR